MNITPEKFQWLVQNVDPAPFYDDVMKAAADPNLGVQPQDPLGQALGPQGMPPPQGMPMPEGSPMPALQPQGMPQQQAMPSPGGMMQGAPAPQVPRGMMPLPTQNQPLKRGF